MKHIEYHLNRVLAVVNDIDLEKRCKPQNGLNCFCSRKSLNFGGNSKISMSKGNDISFIHGNYDTITFNLLDAIINKLQTDKNVGVEVYEPVNIDAFFKSLIERQKQVKTIYKGIKELWNSNNIAYIGADMSAKKMLAVVYDVPRCEVKCYEYNAGETTEIFSGNAEKFNKKAEKDLKGYKAVWDNDHELMQAFKRLWEENKIKLAAERKDKDGVVFMDELQKAEWVRKIEEDAKPSRDIEINEARARYRFEDKQQQKEAL